MTVLMAVGVILVVARFILNWDNWVTLLGLGLISAGFMMTTNYR